MKRSLKYICIGIISLLCVGGMVACGESEAKSEKEVLSAPENVYLASNLLLDRTNYILTWDGDSRADGYTVEIGGVTVNAEETSCDLTRYFAKEPTRSVKVTAVGSGKYETSATTEAECTAEEPTENLTYQADGDGYSVSCTLLKLSGRLVIPDYYRDKKVVSIQDNAFNVYLRDDMARNLTFTSVRLPRWLTKIGEKAFFWCKTLQSVVFPDGVTEIGASAFYAGDLKSVTFSDGITKIGEYAFYANDFESVVWPNSIKVIPKGCFYYCENLKTCVFPEGLTEIQTDAFRLTALEQISIPKSVTTIGDYAFSAISSLKTVELSCNVTQLGESVFGSCTGLENIFVEEGNTKYKSIDGNLYSADGTTLLQYVVGKTEESFVVPSGVTHIAPLAFSGVKNLKRIELPLGLISIGDYAFSGCNGLTVLELPSTIEFVGTSAFADAVNLETVILPNTIKVIWGLSFVSSRIDYLDIPDGVEKIEAYAFGGFFGQRIDYLIIPSSMKDMQTAFGEDPNDATIKRVYYKGNAAAWAEIKGSNYFSWDDSMTVYYYSENEPPLNGDGTAYDGNYWHYDENGVPTVWTKEE